VKRTSKLEDKFAHLLLEMGISYQRQKRVERKIYDFYLPQKNVLIEVDGDFWHCNHKKGIKLGYRFQVKNLKNDALKEVIARKNGFSILRFWENDILHQPEKVKEQLKKI